MLKEVFTFLFKFNGHETLACQVDDLCMSGKQVRLVSADMQPVIFLKQADHRQCRLCIPETCRCKGAAGNILPVVDGLMRYGNGDLLESAHIVREIKLAFGRAFVDNAINIYTIRGII